ncbi:MAG: ACP S-malonyltransferase, partial [Candidatus Bathyarchaeota archaeon]|nr:ACP S-malonyltransferase [Candidatus Bathyarchaeota archaeon]
IAQPAILTVSVAAWSVLKEHYGERLSPRVVAGHSLGEYSALVAVGALTFSSAIELVRTRGLLMKSAGELSEGGMVAILKADISSVDKLCKQAHDITGQVIQIANDNSPGQVVVGGTREALGVLRSLVDESKSGLCIPLDVSIAAHTSLMEPMVSNFERYLSGVGVSTPDYSLLGNVSACPLYTPCDIREELVQQLVSPIRWRESMEKLETLHIDIALEVGPGNVLTKMLRRSYPDMAIYGYGEGETDVSFLGDLL